MFREAFESFSSSLSERLVNPFTGSFLLSWPFWNYKLVLIVFSDSKVQVKISLISSIAYSNWHTALFLGLIAPALTALAYIYWYPLPTRWFVRHSLEQKKKLNSLRQEVDEETLLTKEESDRLRRKYNLGARALEEELEEKNTLIKEMRQQAEKASEGDVKFQREHRKLLADLEVLKARHSGMSNELGNVRSELELARNANQQLSIAKSSSDGQIAGMTREIESLKTSLASAERKLGVISSKYAELERLAKSLEEQKKDALEKYASAQEHSANLTLALDDCANFFSTPQVMDDLSPILKKKARALSTAAYKAML